METKLWILGGMVLVMGTALGFIGRLAVKIIIDRLNEIVKQLQALNTTSALHGQDIKNLQEADIQITQRLNNHAERIRSIELTIKTEDAK